MRMTRQAGSRGASPATCWCVPSSPCSSTSACRSVTVCPGAPRDPDTDTADEVLPEVMVGVTSGTAISSTPAQADASNDGADQPGWSSRGVVGLALVEARGHHGSPGPAPALVRGDGVHGAVLVLQRERLVEAARGIPEAVPFGVPAAGEDDAQSVSAGADVCGDLRDVEVESPLVARPAGLECRVVDRGPAPRTCRAAGVVLRRRSRRSGPARHRRAGSRPVLDFDAMALPASPA